MDFLCLINREEQRWFSVGFINFKFDLELNGSSSGAVKLMQSHKYQQNELMKPEELFK